MHCNTSITSLVAKVLALTCWTNVSLAYWLKNKPTSP